MKTNEDLWKHGELEPYNERFLAGYRRVEKTLLAKLVADENLSVGECKTMAVAVLEERSPGEDFTMSATMIAKRTGMNRRTAERARRRLESKGLLLLVERGGRGKAHRYRLGITGSAAGIDHANTGAQTGRDTGGCAGVFTGKDAGIYEYPNTTKEASASSEAATEQRVAEILETYAELVKPAEADNTRSRAATVVRRALESHTVDEIKAAIARYARSCDDNGTNARFRRGVANFIAEDLSAHLNGDEVDDVVGRAPTDEELALAETAAAAARQQETGATK